MTDADLTDRDRKLIVRMLWTFYLTMLGLAGVCFVGLVITGRMTFLAAGLVACLGAWCVTDPLDAARFEAKTHRQAVPS